MIIHFHRILDRYIIFHFPLSIGMLVCISFQQVLVLRRISHYALSLESQILYSFSFLISFNLYKLINVWYWMFCLWVIPLFNWFHIFLYHSVWRLVIPTYVHILMFYWFRKPRFIMPKLLDLSFSIHWGLQLGLSTMSQFLSSLTWTTKLIINFYWVSLIKFHFR